MLERRGAWHLYADSDGETVTFSFVGEQEGRVRKMSDDIRLRPGDTLAFSMSITVTDEGVQVTWGKPGAVDPESSRDDRAKGTS